MSGSSPHMRGTPDGHASNAYPLGIIPAHAGNTDWQLRWPAPARDHPRTCGEHPSTKRRGASKDHPRTCGEHMASNGANEATLGSSPHMRGTPLAKEVAGARTGIIPAHAGNTPDGIPSHPSSRDHPRTCGEHGTCVHAMFEKWGSSPHMRGTLRMRRKLNVAGRIIPAHAGNTTGLFAPVMMRRDHPRTCGEHLRRKASWHSSAGSSPHMRGTRPRNDDSLSRAGIIPAHAGNTFNLDESVLGREDHPRTCGEHKKRLNRAECRRGSSPHMRGTHFGHPSADGVAGIIPAHAGNTREH